MRKDNQKNTALLSRLLIRWVIKADVFLHMLVALVLILSCFVITFFAFRSVFPLTRESILQVINDMLLILIILELLWTVIRFLKKKRFSLGPFLSIGIIAALRRILLIEAQTSALEHVPIEKFYETALSAGVVLVLIIAYYISYKTPGSED